MKKFTIVFLTEQKNFFYNFLKFLSTLKSPENPCWINSLDYFDFNNLSEIDLIICDSEINRGLIDLAYEILEKHPKIIPIILLVSNRNLFDFDISLTRVTAIIDPINMWDTNWPIITHIQDLYRDTFLQSSINRSSSSDILQMIGTNGWDVIVLFVGLQKTKKIKGCVCFDTGEPLYAWSTNYEGSNAVLEMLLLSQGSLDVVKGLNLLPFKNVTHSLEELLMINALEEDAQN